MYTSRGVQSPFTSHRTWGGGMGGGNGIENGGEWGRGGGVLCSGPQRLKIFQFSGRRWRPSRVFPIWCGSGRGKEGGATRPLLLICTQCHPPKRPLTCDHQRRAVHRPDLQYLFCGVGVATPILGPPPSPKILEWEKMKGAPPPPPSHTHRPLRAPACGTHRTRW